MPYLEVAFNLPIQATYTYKWNRPVPSGCRVQARFGNRKLTGWVLGRPVGAPEGVREIREIDRVIDTEPLFDGDLLELARWLSRLTICSVGEALAAMLPGGRRETGAGPDGGEKSAAGEVRQLTEEQADALEAINRGESGWFYLYGNTGSGKTEVFLRSAEKVIKEDKTVIYLVPEIALSHHLVDSLSHRFPGILAVIHSGLTPSRRLSEWRRIQEGTARFVLGARSAVFAPVRKLGLIIIDEEHEGSYKSSAAPRYHARQIAMQRSRRSGAALVLGSATPSMEAWSMMGSGRLKHLRLQGYPAGGGLPEVRIVDMRREKGLLSPVLVDAMTRVLGRGRQVLLFLNRRGFSYHYSCFSCGEEIMCPHCSVPLTFHKSRNSMICHYCGSRRIPPSSCPNCGSVEMRAAGFGTEKIEEDVAALFPEKRIVRLDADSAGKKGVLDTTLRDFRNGDIDLLLGTQMVAKGLNAPGVKLAGIVAADTGLNLPDFRSAERTFALILQVAGRSGRFRPDGEVVIQTFRPDAAPIRFAAENRVEEFYEYELNQRRLLGYPPFSRLFRVVIRGRPEERVVQAAENLARRLNHGGPDWETLGPAECPIGKMTGAYRWHLMLRSSAFDRTHAALSAALADLKLPRGLRIEADVDPVSML